MLIERCLGPVLQVRETVDGMTKSPGMNYEPSGRNEAQSHCVCTIWKRKKKHDTNHGGLGVT